MYNKKYTYMYIYFFTLITIFDSRKCKTSLIDSGNKTQSCEITEK